MFIILIMVLVHRRIYTYMCVWGGAYQVVHFKCAQLIVCQLYCNEDVKMGRLHLSFSDTRILLNSL